MSASQNYPSWACSFGSMLSFCCYAKITWQQVVVRNATEKGSVIPSLEASAAAIYHKNTRCIDMLNIIGTLVLKIQLHWKSRKPLCLFPLSMTTYLCIPSIYNSSYIRILCIARNMSYCIYRVSFLTLYYILGFFTSWTSLVQLCKLMEYSQECFVHISANFPL